MVEQNVRQDRLSFWRIKRGEIDACIGEGLIGWSKDREWSLTLECFEKLCLNDRCHERIVDTSTLCRSWNIVRCIRWHQYLVNDVDYSVACHHVWNRNVRVIHHDTAIDGKGEWLAIDRISRHALTDVRCRYFSSDDVIEKNVREGCLSFRCVERSEINACIDECLIGWCKHCEWSRTLQC